MKGSGRICLQDKEQLKIEEIVKCYQMKNKKGMLNRTTTPRSFNNKKKKENKIEQSRTTNDRKLQQETKEKKEKERKIKRNTHRHRVLTSERQHRNIQGELEEVEIYSQGPGGHLSKALFNIHRFNFLPPKATVIITKTNIKG